MPNRKKILQWKPKFTTETKARVRMKKKEEEEEEEDVEDEK